MLREHTPQSVELLAQHIRASCERVDTLSNQRTGTPQQQRERLSEAFEELFILLEELRRAEKELRVKNDELMSAQELLEIERERYQELLESAPDAYLFSGPDAVIQESNLAAAELFGVERDRLKGLTMMLFFHETDFPRVREQLSQLRTGDLAKGLEFRIQPRNSPAAHILLTMGAVHDSDGALFGVHWFLRDVTSQKETEEALRLSEERFRSIAQSARDAIIVSDESGNIMSWNKGAEEMFSYAETDIVGKNLTVLMPDRYREDHQKGLQRYQTSGEGAVIGKTTETVGLRKDRSEFPMEISLSSWSANGKTYFTGIIRDITERKQAEETRVRLLERVMEAQEEDRRWIARELHDETGQSLSSLLVGLRMIEEARSLKRAKLEAARLRSVTAQTLDDLGRLARGLRPIVLDDLGLVVALKRHASDFGRSFGIAIHFKTRGLDSDRLPLPLETAFFRIAQEALTNAAKHAGAKNIDIVLEQKDPDIELTIHDDGRGFDPDAILRAAASANHLGIHGMKERAKLLGGTFQIESKPNQGTSVLVRIDKTNCGNPGS